MRILVYVFAVIGFWLSFSVPVFAGPIIVGNGAGEGEYSVIFVRSNLASILEECGALSCQLTVEEQKVLNVLRSQADHAPQTILKKSNELGSHLFELHGKDVWINQDLLWQDTLKTVPFAVGDAAELWAHILATVTNLNSPLVDSVGQKLKLSLMNDTRRGGQSLGSLGTVEFILWNRPATSNLPDSLVIRDPRLATLDLTGAIASVIHCKEPVLPRIFAPAWMPLQTTPLKLTLQFGISWTCEGKTYSTHGLSLVQVVTTVQPAAFDPSTVYTYVEQGAFR